MDYMDTFSGEFYGYDQINGGEPITLSNPVTQNNNLYPSKININDAEQKSMNSRLLKVMNDQMKEKIIQQNRLIL